MPSLPAGFAEKHNNDTSTSDDPKAFLKKDEYLKLCDQVRAATLKAIDQDDRKQFGQAWTGTVPGSFVPTVAAAILMQPTHWMMHAGQWAVIRRKLGKPPLF